MKSNKELAKEVLLKHGCVISKCEEAVKKVRLQAFGQLADVEIFINDNNGTYSIFFDGRNSSDFKNETAKSIAKRVQKETRADVLHLDKVLDAYERSINLLNEIL